MVYRFWVQEHTAKIRERLKHVAFVSAFSQKIIGPFLPSTTHQYVLQNPVDPQREERVDVTQNKRFTYVGRLVPEKDPVTLALAARIANVPVTFVGEGPEREAIMRENPGSEITGWVRPEQVHEKLRQSRAFVIPSIWYECSPLVTVEALSHGLPVICSDTNASKESVEDGVTGFHFEAGDADSLAETLAKLSNPDTASKMSVAAYTRFWDNPPSTKRHIDELEASYTKLIATYK
jgi:glycosyltransferase involved in cell wall biosynthesis